jgi:hypothetical protein
LSLAFHRRRRVQTGLAAAFLFAGSAAFLLLRFPPEQYSFYPQCPIHTYLHLQCPGCGATRALAALLHGRLTEAFHRNALFIAGVVPAAALYAALCLFRLRHNEPFRWPAPPVRWRNPLLYASLAIAVAFAILRNLHA